MQNAADFLRVAQGLDLERHYGEVMHSIIIIVGGVIVEVCPNRHHMWVALTQISNGAKAAANTVTR